MPLADQRKNNNHNSSPYSALITFIKLLIHSVKNLTLTLLSVVVLVSCATPKYNSANSVVRLENAKSHMLLKDFRSAGVIYPSVEFEQLSKRILQRLYPTRHTRYKIHLARLPEYNAFALPTGVVVLHLGLLALLENEDQLAFVLAHEIAHVEARDSYTSAHHRRRSRIKAQLADILSFGSGASFAHYASQLRSASRLQEMVADKLAARVVHEAGYDLSAAIVFFGLLQAYSEDTVSLRRESTHPSYAERRTQVNNFQRHHSSAPLSVETKHKNQQSNEFNALRLSILPFSIEDKIEGLAFLNALQQIDELELLGADTDLIHCLKGQVFAGIAQVDPASFINVMNQRHLQGLEEHAIMPQVYAVGVEKKYFHARALGEFLAVLNLSTDTSTVLPQQVRNMGMARHSLVLKSKPGQEYICAVRGAGLSSHALGQLSLASRYFKQYLKLVPDALDARYIEHLQKKRTAL